MPLSRFAAAVALAGAGFALAACGSDDAPPSSSAPSASAASSAPPSSSAPVASSAAPSAASSAAPSAGGSGRTGSCTDPDAKYCDDFSDTSSGWPTQNTASGYTQYDPYLGGSYRIGVRSDGTVAQPAPVRLGAVSSTYSVQIDGDVTVGQSSSNATAAGFRCWSGATADGRPTGFQLTVDGSSAQIGVYSSLSGQLTVIKNVPFTGLRLGTTNSIAVQCVQANGANGVEARLAMRVNGQDAVSASYGKSTQQVSWNPTDQMALVGLGSSGADVFFDNLSVAPVQAS